MKRWTRLSLILIALAVIGVGAARLMSQKNAQSGK